MNTMDTKAVTAAAEEMGLRPVFWTRAPGFTLYDSDGRVAARVIDDRGVDGETPFVGVIRPRHLRRVGYEAPYGSTGISGEGKYFSYPHKSLEGLLTAIREPSRLDK
ncbi:MAG TPA: hypothetical protein VE288_14140 [Rubrobacteraceae bacterium]|jgi:hypothetical protein|nr:hypothetical protein [Rubrobacteraceae bacterium]